jgi:DNA-binding Lrp family transcriptional regulator
MEELNIIEYVPLIDHSTLGYTYYRINIESTIKWNTLNKIIQKTNQVVWLVERYDQENFVLVLLAKKFSEIQKIWEEIQEQISQEIISKDISLIYKVHHLPARFIHHKKQEIKYITGCGEEIKLNKLQKQIIDYIQKNPKFSIQELSRITNTHTQTVKDTLQKLEQNKVILAYQTILNKEVLGVKHYKIYITFNFTQKRKQEAISLLSQYENVVYISETSYHHDLEFEVLCFEELELEKTLNSFKEKFEVKRVIVSHTKREIKNS